MSYSLASLLNEYSKNKEMINAYLQNKTVEGFDDDNNAVYIGLGIGMFITIVVFVIIIWIWALVVTIKYWKVLPDWARVLAILGLIPVIPGGPIVSLIVVYIAKGSRHGGGRKRRKSGKKKRRKKNR
jgi:hypothetical protein|tara:strand:+ start:267 stop:647 length:381 start_codon:yes stop_codon:yes gene_type:complete